MARAVEPTTTAVAIALVSSALSPIAASGGDLPAESPLVWGLLAYARRQLGQGQALSTAEGSGDNAAPTGAAQVNSPKRSGVVTGRVVASDVDGDRLRYSGSVVTDKGRVTVSSSGRFQFRPTSAARHAAAATDATDADTSDMFTVTVTDGRGGSASVPVTVTVVRLNATPRISRARAGRPDADTGEAVVSLRVRDRDGDDVSVTAHAVTEKGSVADNGDGTFTYTPSLSARLAAGADRAPRSAKTDTVTLTVTDDHGGVTSATVVVAIAPTTAPVNNAPIRSHVDVGEPGSAGVVTGVVSAIDPDGDSLTYSGPSVTDKGLLKVNPDGSFVYTPSQLARHAAAAVSASSAAKQDSFGVTVSDGRGGTVVVPVTVTISPSNTAPHVTATAGQPDPGTGAVTGSVTATDADGDHLTFTGSTNTSKGTVVITPTGAFRYQPFEAARQAAGATDAPESAKYDTVSLAVSDAHGGVTPITVTVAVAPDILDPTELLSLVTEGTVEVVQNQDGTVGVIDGRFTENIVRNSADAAQAINRIAELLGATTGFAFENDVTVERVDQLTAGGEFSAAYFRLRPTVNGLPVLGSEVVLVTDGNGQVRGVFSGYDPLLGQLDTTPTPGMAGSADAEAAATAAVVSRVNTVAEQSGMAIDQAAIDELVRSLSYDTELVVYGLDRGTAPQLVWHVDVFAGTPENGGSGAAGPVQDGSNTRPNTLLTTFYINANGTAAGTVLAESTPFEAAAAIGSAVGLKGSYTFNYETTSSGAILNDTVRNIQTYTIVRSADFWETVFPALGWGHISETPVPVAYQSGWDVKAVTVHANMEKVYDYYHTVLNRDSFDGDGAKIEIYENALLADNASWTRAGRSFNFGTGAYEAAIDVIGHEFTHGVIQYVVGHGSKDYGWASGESGALNEAYADIIGALIERYYAENAFMSNWTIGENTNAILRDLSNPALYTDPDGYTYATDYLHRYDTSPTAYDDGGEHLNSTIFSYAAYKMMNAEATKSITNETWALLFYSSLVGQSSGSTFAEATSHVLMASKVLGFTPDQMAAVEDAFREVHILPTRGYVPPTATIATGAVTVPGVAAGTGNTAGVAAINATGTRAVVITDEPNDTVDESRVILIDTATGHQVAGILVNGNADARFDPSGSRLVITSVEVDPASQAQTTHVRVVDSGTGAQVGSTVTLTGGVWQPVFNTTGNRTVFVAFDQNAGVSHVAVVNTVTGTQLGSTLAVEGSEWNTPAFTPSGDRVVLLHLVGGGPTPRREPTILTIIDTSTGAQVGSTIGMPDRSNLYLSADGSRAMVVTSLSSLTADDPMTEVVVVDTATARRVGNTVSVVGEPSGWSIDWPALSASGPAVITTVTGYGLPGRTYTRRIALVDLATGTQVGSTRVFDTNAVGVTAQTAQGTRTAVMVP